MTKSTLKKLDTAILSFCIACWIGCIYLAATIPNPIFFILSVAPYILIYNVLFRGCRAGKWVEETGSHANEVDPENPNRR